MNGQGGEAPRWVGYALIPLINILLAFLVSGLIVYAIGVDPFEAMSILVYGAFGFDEAIGYTLYYTTNFIFTGLAVAVGRPATPEERPAHLHLRQAPKAQLSLPEVVTLSFPSEQLKTRDGHET